MLLSPVRTLSALGFSVFLLLPCRVHAQANVRPKDGRSQPSPQPMTVMHTTSVVIFGKPHPLPFKRTTRLVPADGSCTRTPKGKRRMPLDKEAYRKMVLEEQEKRDKKK